MKLLNKVNENFYSYFDKDTKMLFTLKYGDRGVCGKGKAWYLYVTYDGVKQSMATFSVKDDGYKTYKEDYLGWIWEVPLAIYEADKMVRKMLGY